MSAKIPSTLFIGKSYNHLTIEKALPDTNGYRIVLARCVCGDSREYHLDNIVASKSKSCGCVRKSIKTHGLSEHKLYLVWAGMKRRCLYKKDHAYKRYGGRGVMICREWVNDFKVFYDWAISNGWRDGLELDKDIKGDGKLYSPDTCCFVTCKQNANKRSTSKYLEFNGQTKTVAQWSDIVGISQQVIYKRMRRGWGIEKTLTHPMMKNAYA